MAYLTLYKRQITHNQDHPESATGPAHMQPG